MIDIIYIAGTIVFFALMIVYVAACDRFGRSHDAHSGADPAWQSATEPHP
jgi:hypothetical protein